MLQWPKVYISSEGISSDRVASLTKMVKRWKGETVSEDAATLVVRRFGDEEENSEDDWMRPLEQRANKVLVHWWYKPDSYDNLVPAAEVTEDPIRPAVAKKYIVSTRMITDTNKYHEWVNPEDYLEEEVIAIEAAPASVSEKARSRKRKGKNRLTSQRSKRSRHSSTVSEEKDADYFKDMPAPPSPKVEVVDVNKKLEEAAGKKDPDLARVRAAHVVNATNATGDGKDPFFKDAVTDQEQAAAEEAELRETPEPAGATGEGKEVVEISPKSEKREQDKKTTVPETSRTEPNSVKAIKASSVSDSAVAEKETATDKSDASAIDVDATMADTESAPTKADGAENKSDAMDVDKEVDTAPKPTPVAPVKSSETRASAESAADKEKNITDVDSQETAPMEPEEREATVTEPEIEEQGPDKYYAEQTDMVVVPSHSAWFDYNAIHSIEKRALPEFFTGNSRSKTPEIYMAYRNFMVDTYRLRPKEYLTATACRRNMTGDVCAILRVHAFLEQWGLINYQADFDLRSGPLGPPSTSHFRVAAETPQGVQHIRTTTVSEQKTIESLIQLDSADALLKKDRLLDTRKDQYADAAKGPCGTCGAPCTSAVFRCNKATPELVLCHECFSQGQYPEEFGSNDFTKQNIKDDNVVPWTDQETLRLLEGIEMFKDDWVEISDHVGTHDQAECVLHFLRLPIQDPYLEPEIVGAGALACNPIPFSQTENPIMNTVAFLASVIDPAVAAAAAEAALAEYKSLGTEEWANDENDKENNEKGQTTQPTMSAAATDKLKLAATAAMSMAAVKAHALAEREEAEVRGLMAEIIECQLKKLEIKMNQFEKLESLMENEYHKLEAQRKELLRDKIKHQELEIERDTLQADCAALREELINTQKRLNQLQPAAASSPTSTTPANTTERPSANISGVASRPASQTSNPPPSTSVGNSPSPAMPGVSTGPGSTEMDTTR
ncbi:hypothetical protein SARC_04609 [Sphaeroforma arctica JP610]|uniref:SWIRM domain-containing protein n=1 Tax=Sphaeroforma arctica JP610 TaxID=667725 RepID=A0A0L0G1Y2_9EUKA|nr:hypothetical protein SARC_04609 [Sphaeroforma arctica JP610]KNC83137.1 hypothetical protein SARC_04609 [Sphaeroforma arctica JP610]|eukprot:XP_014157039.1 hypothetical protein SARC_04609 [Sphaeroforma arctica JP610]